MRWAGTDIRLVVRRCKLNLYFWRYNEEIILYYNEINHNNDNAKLMYVFFSASEKKCKQKVGHSFLKYSWNHYYSRRRVNKIRLRVIIKNIYSNKILFIRLLNKYVTSTLLKKKNSLYSEFNSQARLIHSQISLIPSIYPQNVLSILH